MLADIEFQCVHCGQLLAVEPSGAGHCIDCPACGLAVRVPELTAGRTPRSVTEPVEEVVASFSSRDGTPTEADSELVSVRKSAGELARALTEAREENKRLLRRIDQMAAERASLSQANTSLQADLKRMDEDRESLRNTLEISRQRVASTEVHLEAKERELRETQGHLADARQEGEAAQMQVEQILKDCDELRAQLEEAGAALEAAANLEDELFSAREEIGRMEGALLEANDEIAATQTRLQEMERENATLRHDLSESEMGREILDLRGLLKIAEEERSRAVAIRTHAEADCARALEAERKLRGDIEKLLQRCEAAERRAEASGELQLQKDNEVLRGILARQKEEMDQRYSELSRLRRANLGVRMMYAMVSLGVIGLVALIVRVLPIASFIGG